MITREEMIRQHEESVRKEQIFWIGGCGIMWALTILMVLAISASVFVGINYEPEIAIPIHEMIFRVFWIIFGIGMLAIVVLFWKCRP